MICLYRYIVNKSSGFIMPITIIGGLDNSNPLKWYINSGGTYILRVIYKGKFNYYALIDGGTWSIYRKLETCYRCLYG